MKKNKNLSLSRRELDVMNVLWEADRPLIASEIPKENPNLSINTVQSVLKKLLQRNIIKIGDIVHSGTVLSRSYLPAITPEEYSLYYVKSEVFPFGKFLPKVQLFDALFDTDEADDSVIEELEKLIQERKNDTKKK